MKNAKYISKQDLEKLYNLGLEEQRLSANLGLEIYRMGYNERYQDDLYCNAYRGRNLSISR